MDRAETARMAATGMNPVPPNVYPVAENSTPD